MARRVHLHPVARTGLFGLYDVIAARSGVERADGYLARIEQIIRALADHPERGRLRDEIARGLCTLAMECRALIAYRVEEEVTVLRVLYAGRDFGSEDLPG